jgi:hypothetical protein
VESGEVADAHDQEKINPFHNGFGNSSPRDYLWREDTPGYRMRMS